MLKKLKIFGPREKCYPYYLTFLVDCQYGIQQKGDCSVSCGTGQMQECRVVTVQAAYGGKTCKQDYCWNTNCWKPQCPSPTSGLLFQLPNMKSIFIGS